jgi:ribosomal protein S6--L-glutamate ligase
MVADRGELKELDWAEPVAVAQPLLPSDGVDLKLYGIGERVWAVRKRSPLRRDGASGCGEPAAEPVALNSDLERLGLRCGRLFGLELWGVDCIETPSGPLVIEVNEFPNYSGVPQVNERLAEHVLSRIRAAP